MVVKHSHLCGWGDGLNCGLDELRDSEAMLKHLTYLFVPVF